MGLLQKIKNLNKKKDTVSYMGNYKTLVEAEKLCEGYDSETIFNKVKASTMAVVRGEAAYERDSYLFYEKSTNYNLMMYLFKIAYEEQSLRICDWGGALGSTFFQHRELLEGINYDWTIVEQEHFVKFGQEELARENLHFCYDFQDVQNCNCVIFSSVLQYLRNAVDIIDMICNKVPRYIIVERTPVSKKQIICIEKVHEPIYEASYALCVHKEDEFIELFLKNGYRLVDSWKSLVDGDEIVDKTKIEFKSYVFIYENE